jgi:predicted small metal-binding protein
MAESKRVVLDCRKAPGSNCSLTIAGTEEEVIETAAFHVKSKHGYKDTPELRKQIRSWWQEEALTH